MVYGDFTSVKSAIASSAVSNSGPVSRLPLGRLGADDRVPAAGLVQTREHRCGLPGEDVHDLRVELRPAPLPGHRDGRLGAARPVEDLHHVGQRDQPGGEQDLLSPGALGDALAVPALEGLLDAVPDPLGQAQPLPQPVGRQPVVLDHGLGHPAAVTRETSPRAARAPPGAGPRRDGGG